MKCFKCGKEMDMTPVCCECGSIPIAEASFKNIEMQRDALKKALQDLMGRVFFSCKELDQAVMVIDLCREED